jgi:tRNA pseudouridine38-40 synthase
VVHFDALLARPESAWVRGVNALLPPGMAVLWAKAVAGDFHARFSALERSYRYILLNHPVRPALLAGRVGWVHGVLDLSAMRAAAALLAGTHDFSAFRAAACQAKSPVRELRSAEVWQRGNFLTFEFRGNAFLHHQVRNMVGALVWVGLGRRPAEWIGDLLVARDRRLGAATFAPDGLYLACVRYAAGWELPAFPERHALLDNACPESPPARS